MNITDELIETIEKRVKEYCVAHKGSEPDSIMIEEGQIIAEWREYYCGETDYEHVHINVDDLTKDLDVVYAERKERERIAAEKARIEYQKKEEKRQKILKEKRRKQYLELKEEFENE